MKKLMLAATVAAAIAFGVVACGGTDLGAAPDVRGLALPDAKQELKQAGYTASVKTNALFGVIVEEHYSVCSQSKPKGMLVPIEADKDCQ
jgi:beta-lactam-binding protein with PASTA domain